MRPRKGVEVGRWAPEGILGAHAGEIDHAVGAPGDNRGPSAAMKALLREETAAEPIGSREASDADRSKL
jgi:hypothetical protein